MASRPRRRAARAVAAAIVAAWAAAGCAAPPSERPNVVLVVVDTLRADRLPEYGFELPTSGALAELFAASTRFECVRSTSSWTPPAVASIFTGVLPARLGIRGLGARRLPDAARSLAELLAARGWRTAGFSHNLLVTSKSRFDQGFERFSAFEGGDQVYPDASEMVAEAVEWLDDESARPFFLYLQPMNVHGPYWVPPEHQRVLLGRDPGRAFPYLGPIHRAVMDGGPRRRELVSAEMVTGLHERYATAVRYTLDRLGEVVAELRRRGLYERSLIVVTSDHGEELYDHGGFSHGYTLHEEVVRVPLFVKLPGSARGRQAVTTPASLVDVAPTILELLGIEPPPGLDGRSLAAEIAGTAAAAAERELALELDEPRHGVARGLVAGRHKLIEVERDHQGRAGVKLLFDLAEDPAERTDVAAARPELAAELSRRLAAVFAGLHARALPGAAPLEDETDPAALRALGYL